MKTCILKNNVKDPFYTEFFGNKTLYLRGLDENGISYISLEPSQDAQTYPIFTEYIEEITFQYGDWVTFKEGKSANTITIVDGKGAFLAYSTIKDNLCYIESKYPDGTPIIISCYVKNIAKK